MRLVLAFVHIPPVVLTPVVWLLLDSRIGHTPQGRGLTSYATLWYAVAAVTLTIAVRYVGPSGKEAER